MKYSKLMLPLMLIVLTTACKKEEIENDTNNSNTSSNAEIEAKLEIIYDDTIAPADVTFINKTTGDYTGAKLTINADALYPEDKYVHGFAPQPDTFTYTVEQAGSIEINLEAFHHGKGTTDEAKSYINLHEPDSGRIYKVEMLQAGEVNGEVAVPDNFQIQVEDLYTYTIYTSETLPNVSETNLPVWENVNCKFESFRYDSYINEFEFLFRQGSEEIYSSYPDGPGEPSFPQKYEYDSSDIDGPAFYVYFEWY